MIAMFQRLILVTLLGLSMTTPAFAGMPPALAEQVAKLTAADAEGSDWFGWSVSMSDTLALVGAHHDDDGGSSSGSAYVFERDEGGAGNWGQVAKLTAADAVEMDYFGYSVALSDTTALVGAYGDDDGGSESGSAYIFERDEGGAGNWGQVAKLTAADAAAMHQFGFSVAVSGTTALVGAWRNDDDGTDSGSAYIFERDEGGVGNWGQVAKLTAADADVADQFGRSVAMNGTTALVGARLDDDGGTDSGSAYVFERDAGGAGTWGQVAKLTAGDAAEMDHFGRSVAVSGTYALVGALQDDDAGTDSGSAYVFERDAGGAGSWGQVAKLTADDAAPDDWFGERVALSGTTALIGARYDDDAGNASGSAYLFERNEGGAGNWGQVAKLTADDAAIADFFGRSVALSSATALVGAYTDDDGGSASGSAYVFSTGISSSPTAHLQIPAAIPTGATPVDVPVILTSNGVGLAATAFSIDYDEACLDFDPTDADLDGIPDAVTFHTPAHFAAAVFFDLGDTDGEIDISLSETVLPPTPLADGNLVTVTFTPKPICIPTPPAKTLAPVLFSTDPSASFGDLSAQSVVGTTEDGSVEIFSGTPGDCNGDGLVDAADLFACTLELFDGDGNAWTDVPGGTFAGLPVGCDANADTVVDAGDMTCKSRLIFGLDCGGGTVARLGGLLDGPGLRIPRSLPTDQGTVILEVDFSPGDSAISATVFALDIDTAQLTFDSTDDNLDGIPDAVEILGAPISHRSVVYDPARTDGELSFLIADLIQTPRQLADGPLVRIELQTLSPAPEVVDAMRFADGLPASFGDVWGNSIAGNADFNPGTIFRDGFESGDLAFWSTGSSGEP